MPHKQEAIDMRMKLTKEAIEEVEKVEDFLKKGAVELYTDIITPDIEKCVNNNLFSDIAVTIDYCTNVTYYPALVEKLFKAIEHLNIKKINENNIKRFFNNNDNPILYFQKKEEGYIIFYRKSYLQEIVEKDGYRFEHNKEDDVITISATVPKLIKDENGKVLIKKD